MNPDNMTDEGLDNMMQSLFSSMLKMDGDGGAPGDGNEFEDFLKQMQHTGGNPFPGQVDEQQVKEAQNLFEQAFK